MQPVFHRALTLAVFLPALFVTVGCPCAGAEVGADHIRELVDQLHGGRCAYSTDPTKERPDSTCKVRPFYSSFFFLRGPRRHVCVEWAAECLGNMGPAAGSAVPDLVKALKDGPNDYDTGDGVIPTRSRIAWALGEIGDPAAVPALIHALKRAESVDFGLGAIPSRRPAARTAIARALAEFGPKAREAAPALMKVLSENPSQPMDTDQAEAARALGAIGATEAVPLLTKRLRKPGRHASRCADALGMLTPASSTAADTLAQVVASPQYDRFAKWQALEALGKIRDEQYLPVLVQALRDPELAAPAARALKEFGSRAAPAIEDLIAFVQVPAGADRDPATGALHFSSPATSAHSARVAVVKVLESVATSQAFDALAALLTDHELSSGSRIVKALIRMDPQGDRARREFLKLLNADDPWVRRTGIRGLGRLGNTEDIPLLIDLARSEECRIRDAAIRALCRFKDAAREALPALRALSSAGNRCNHKLLRNAIACIDQ